MLCLGALLAGLCGCADWPRAAAPRPLGQLSRPIMPLDRPGQSVNEADYYLVVQIRLGVVELPAGTISNSEEIWSYLDEEAIAANRWAGLDRNGLRAGVGRPDVWPDLERILKQMAGREVDYRTLATIPGQPATIVLKDQQGEQQIFTFYTDRTLSGSIYPPGDNILTLSCSLNPDDPTLIHVAVVPQIRGTAARVGVLGNPTGPALAPVKDIYSFEPLAFRAPVPAKGLLVVGPGQRCQDPYSLGHQFLTLQREGVRYETVLVMIPEVFAAPRRPQ
jgi:hypothetical protein